MLRQHLETRLGLRDARFIVIDGYITEKKMNGAWQEIHKQLEKNIKQLFCLILTTNGGDWDAARVFYSKVKFFDVNLITVAVGRVASAGVVVFLAGKRRYAEENTEFMDHQATADRVHTLTQKNLQNAINEVAAANAEALRIIASCSRCSRQELAKLYEHDIYLDAYQAKRMGWVHKIIKEGG